MATTIPRGSVTESISKKFDLAGKKTKAEAKATDLRASLEAARQRAADLEASGGSQADKIAAARNAGVFQDQLAAEEARLNDPSLYGRS